MKKLAFIVIITFGIAAGFTSKVTVFLQKEVQSISGMSKSEFNEFVNKKHYLVKSWAIDPKKMDPETYKALFETLNFQTTALNYMKKQVKNIY